jgi:histidyl-tRNA synthetase
VTTRDAAAALRTVREAGFSGQMEQAGRSLKGQLKQADRVGARVTLILGQGVSVKDMGSGAQRDTPDMAAALDALKEILA